jgi:three-Cys-motif partner protein
MARISKLHTEEKLTLLKKYLEGYVIATKNAKERYYIDALAGDGQCEIQIPNSTQPRTVDGSPLIAMNLKPGFTKCFFIEIDKEKVETLSKLLKGFPQNRYNIKEGDCNFVIDEILSEIPLIAPCFAFLDPEGFEVDWTTIEKIATYKRDSKTKIELFILFPYNMAITRLLPLNSEKFDEEKATSVFNRILPDYNWIDVYNARIKGRLKPREMRKSILDIFTNGLKKLGYRFVYSKLIRSSKRRPLYDMFFATDHKAGAVIMEYVFGKDWIRGQISFLDKLT